MEKVTLKDYGSIEEDSLQSYQGEDLMFQEQLDITQFNMRSHSLSYIDSQNEYFQSPKSQENYQKDGESLQLLSAQNHRPTALSASRSSIGQYYKERSSISFTSLFNVKRLIVKAPNGTYQYGMLHC
ncbi:UNKNOWN [Stylonychia lemnae]|uniref:Uncharacterized protein n=1 Tax=Stylonychia lemnae TaxID=5949 RepID=A0A077ZXS1_STYLE|nr:UNKNOWN [Stylonychia lemnae]|eukprot:CDW74705.1 UNKNOWN [Stylonychia lemnae]